MCPSIDTSSIILLIALTSWFSYLQTKSLLCHGPWLDQSCVQSQGWQNKERLRVFISMFRFKCLITCMRAVIFFACCQVKSCLACYLQAAFCASHDSASIFEATGLKQDMSLFAKVFGNKRISSAIFAYLSEDELWRVYEIKMFEKAIENYKGFKKITIEGFIENVEEFRSRNMKKILKSVINSNDEKDMDTILDIYTVTQKIAVDVNFPLEELIKDGNLAYFEFCCKHLGCLDTDRNFRLDDMHILLELNKGFCGFAHEMPFQGTPCLVQAVESNQMQIVQFILEKCVDINAKDFNDITALHKAASLGYLPMVKCLVEALIKANGNINPRDVLDRTPTLLAAQKGHKDVVKFLYQTRLSTRSYKT